VPIAANANYQPHFCGPDDDGDCSWIRRKTTAFDTTARFYKDVFTETACGFAAEVRSGMISVFRLSDPEQRPVDVRRLSRRRFY
jgi:hypothetical protein